MGRPPSVRAGRVARSVLGVRLAAPPSLTGPGDHLWVELPLPGVQTVLELLQGRVEGVAREGSLPPLLKLLVL